MAGSTADAAVNRATLHRVGGLAGLLAGPFFLISVGLNTWASLDYLQQLGWEFVGGEQVPWPSSLARGPYGWAQIATFVITGLAIVTFAVALRDQLPHRRASGVSVALLALSGVALILAAFRVDTPMLSGASPATWHGWVHVIAFLLIIAMGVLAPLTMARAVRGDAGWRPMTIASVAACALFVVFLFLPWGNATFLLAIITFFAWIVSRRTSNEQVTPSSVRPSSAGKEPVEVQMVAILTTAPTGACTRSRRPKISWLLER